MGMAKEVVAQPFVVCDPDDDSHIQLLAGIAQKDANGLAAAHGHYGNSWKKRGGVGAFMMLARKWDRLEELLRKKGYDIFQALHEDDRGEGLIDDIRDLRRYLLLVESEAQARGIKCAGAAHRDNIGEMGEHQHPTEGCMCKACELSRGILPGSD